MANNAFRVVIPRNTRDLLRLLGLIGAKHVADGPASKLSVMDNVAWTEMVGRVRASTTKQDQVDVLRRQAETMQGEIDRDKEEYTDAARATRDFLLGLNAANPRRLGDWGYEVNDSDDDEEEGGGVPVSG